LYAGLALRSDATRLPEPLEEMREFFGWNADASVHDRARYDIRFEPHHENRHPATCEARAKDAT
jgi:hypothetical protein